MILYLELSEIVGTDSKGGKKWAVLRLTLHASPEMEDKEYVEHSLFRQTSLSELDEKRRQLLYRILSEVNWKFESKYRNIARFFGKIPVNVWLAIDTLCNYKYVLTKERLAELVNSPLEKIVEEFQAIRLAYELAGEQK